MNGGPECCCSGNDVGLTQNGSVEQKIEYSRTAFTLLEVLIVLAIVSILALTFQTPIQNFYQQALTQQIESSMGMGIQRFQLLLKAELAQAGYGLLPSEQVNAIELVDGTLSLKADLNRDGDLNDAKEQIFYRFDDDKQMLLRRSGKGGFQRFIEGIAYLNFAYWDTDSTQVCLKLTTQVLKQTDLEESVICSLSPF